MVGKKSFFLVFNKSGNIQGNNGDNINGWGKVCLAKYQTGNKNKLEWNE